MKRSRGVRSLLALGVIGTCLVPAAAADAAPPSAAAPVPLPDDLLSAAAGGTAAIEALGPDIAIAAAANDMSVQELTDLLVGDSSARVDTTGRVLFVDPAFDGAAPAGPVAAGPFPYAQTFLLHSRTGAQRTIYLDFNGATVTGTAWNANFGVASSVTGFDLDGNTASFSDAEQDSIQSIWQRVSEDYAPFNIDVTTQAPAAAALTRTNAADLIYGTTVLITSDSAASLAVCANSCGGIAYVGVFDEASLHSYYQPALVFPHMLSLQTKPIAEATSHEAGHNLGLSHDGPGYYGGHGSWAPIMGSSYSKPISQWASGEYNGADNVEDDLSVIQANGGTLMTDDHGDTVGAATVLTGTGPFTGGGLISTRADRDVFAFTATCAGISTFTVTPAPTSPNLDVRARLLSSTGTQLASVDPSVATTSSDTASGMAASFTTSLAAGSYRIEVDGVGFGNPVDTGYSDYGSLGQYTVSATACAAVAANNTFANAIALTGSQASFAGTNVGATGQTGEPGGSPALNTLWWRWTAPTTGTATFHTTGSDFNTYLCVYTGSALASLTSRGCNDDTGDTQQSSVGVSVVSGTTYQIQVDGAAAAIGNIVGGVSAPPVNDAFSQAVTLASDTTATGNNTLATAQTGETGGSAPLHTVWWRWIAPSAGTMTADTNGSAIDTYLCIHTGTAVGSTTQRGCDDDSGVDNASLITLAAVSGTTYMIQVDGYADIQGALALRVGFVPTQTGVPGVPTGFTLTKNDTARTATMTWTPPASDGGSPITGYRVSRSAFGTHAAFSTTVAATARTQTMQNLTAGGTYTLSVEAINATGTGPAASGVVTINTTTPTAPGVPTGFTLTKNDTARTATMTWTPPASDGGSPITGYRVSRSAFGTHAAFSTTVAATARTQTMQNLTAGGTYTLSVEAINAIGTGPAASGVVTINTTATVPGAPIIGTATAGVAGGAITATAAWSPPTSSGGSTITGYVVRALRMSTTGTVLSTTTSAVQAAASRSLSMTLPQTGNYRFTVQAINSVGSGAQSTRSNLVAGR